MNKGIFFALTLLSSSIALATEKENREQGAHEHGHAQLNVVLEKNELLLSIETPANNVFGFEHKPNNHEQEKTVQLAVDNLKNFSTLVAFDSGAKCVIAKAEVNQPFELDHDDHDDDHKDEHKDEHDDHKDDHKDEHDDHKDDHKDEHDDHKDDHKDGHDDHKDEHDDHIDEHKHDEHDDDHKESTHSDVDIEVSFNCENPSKLTKMDLTPLFTRFPLFVELEAQGIINGQQTAAELSKSQPTMSLEK